MQAYGAALKESEIQDKWGAEGSANNRAETSHQPFRRRRRAMLRYRRFTACRSSPLSTALCTTTSALTGASPPNTPTSRPTLRFSRSGGRSAPREFRRVRRTRGGSHSSDGAVLCGP